MLCSNYTLQVANHADVDAEEETVVTDPVSGTTTTMRLPKHFQIKCAASWIRDISLSSPSLSRQRHRQRHDHHQAGAEALPDQERRELVSKLASSQLRTGEHLDWSFDAQEQSAWCDTTFMISAAFGLVLRKDGAHNARKLELTTLAN